MFSVPQLNLNVQLTLTISQKKKKKVTQKKKYINHAGKCKYEPRTHVSQNMNHACT